MLNVRKLHFLVYYQNSDNHLDYQFEYFLSYTPKSDSLTRNFFQYKKGNRILKYLLYNAIYIIHPSKLPKMIRNCGILVLKTLRGKVTTVIKVEPHFPQY